MPPALRILAMMALAHNQLLLLHALLLELELELRHAVLERLSASLVLQTLQVLFAQPQYTQFRLLAIKDR